MSDSETDKLSPCPFCGAAMHIAATEDGKEWGVECCGCDSVLIFKDSKEEAIKACNRRAKLDNPACFRGYPKCQTEKK